MKRLRTYRGEFREIAELDPGESTVIDKPSNETIDAHRKRVHNAVANYADTRKRHFQCRTNPISGTVTVTRIVRDETGLIR